MSDLAIKAEGLSKRYRIGQYVGGAYQYRALRDILTDAMYAPFRHLRARSKQRAVGSNPTTMSHEPSTHQPIHSSTGFIWALKNISFEVKRGEVVGIIGRNGAGKTTLLKVLSRITEPTEGRAEIKGFVGSLLEVGTGFHPELTGRENTYLSGAILGMTKKEIDRKFDEIVDFSGIEKFIDTPAKRYSSGMLVRLGFAVAAHLEPEILLVDEVLAVGDAEFQRKCLGKMRDVTEQGRTVLFVSHNMTAIRNLCRRTLLIDQGRISLDGDTEAAVTQYLSNQNPVTGAVAAAEELDRKVQGSNPRQRLYFQCREIALLDKSGQPRNEFDSDEEITVSITYECFQNTPALKVIIVLTDDSNQSILRSENVDDPRSMQHYILKPGLYRTCCVLPRDLFGGRRFYVSVHLIYQDVQHLDFRKVLSFDVNFKGYSGDYSIHSRRGGQVYIRPRLPWHTAKITIEEVIDDAG